MFYGVLLAFLAVAVWEDAGEAAASAGREAALLGNLYTDMEGLPPPLACACLRAAVDREWLAQAQGRAPPGTSAAPVALHRHVAVLAPVDGGDAIVMARHARHAEPARRRARPGWRRSAATSRRSSAC